MGECTTLTFKQRTDKAAHVLVKCWLEYLMIEKITQLMMEHSTIQRQYPEGAKNDEAVASATRRRQNAALEH